MHDNKRHTALKIKALQKKVRRPVHPSRPQIRYQPTINTTVRAVELTPEPEPSINESPPSEEENNDSKPSNLTTPLRSLMRTLPNPVVILTTALPSDFEPEPSDGTSSPERQESDLRMPRKQAALPRHFYYRAMTLSSFTTVTLDKDAVISFNIRVPSKTLHALNITKHFLIHILDATPAGARLAAAFTKGGSGAEWFENREEGGPVRVIEETVEETEALSLPDRVLPRLEGEGVKSVLKCSVWNRRKSKLKRSIPSIMREGILQVEDHAVCFGVVEEILGDVKGGEAALGYADGKFRDVGEVIDVEERKGDV